MRGLVDKKGEEADGWELRFTKGRAWLERGEEGERMKGSWWDGGENYIWCADLEFFFAVCDWPWRSLFLAGL